MTGLKRVATKVAMYKAERTGALPPETERLPRNRPLSRLWGATPTSEAISLRFKRPSSGRWTSSTLDATGPTPGTLRSRSSVACHTGLDWMNRSSSPFRSPSSPSSQAMCCLIPGWTYTVAFGRRFRSAVIIPTTWRRRAMSPRSSCSLSPGRGRTGGFIASPNLASTYRVDGIGLCQPTGGSGKVPDLSWIDDGYRHTRCGQLSRHHHLKPSRRLQHRYSRIQGLHPTPQRGDALWIVACLPHLSGR